MYWSLFCTFSSYYFLKETRKSFCVFEYCNSFTWYVARLSNSLKKSRLFFLFVTVLKWLRFVDQVSIFRSLYLIGSWLFSGELRSSSLCLLWSFKTRLTDEILTKLINFASRSFLFLFCFQLVYKSSTDDNSKKYKTNSNRAWTSWKYNLIYIWAFEILT